jgi:inner membrane protein
VPTILSHPAVPLAIGLGLGAQVISRRLLLAGVTASVLPDLDVLAFRLGISYSHELGHRGMSHSLAFALLLGLLALLFAPQLRATQRTAGLFIFTAAASHGLLDMFTNGGLGVALLWPFSDDRFFFPARVIEVSPLSLRRFFGPSGVHVLSSELLWVWLPSAVAGLAVRLTGRPSLRGS